MNLDLLKDFTSEELRAELKRRAEERRAEKAKVLRCRNCKFMVKPHEHFVGYQCQKRTYFIGGHERYYIANPSQKASECEHFELKTEE